MAAHTSWTSEAPVLNQTAAFKVEDAARRRSHSTTDFWVSDYPSPGQISL
jgi:hypothetical protein